jgi:hypothetical protein
VNPASRRARLSVAFTLAAAFAGTFAVVTLAKAFAVPRVGIEQVLCAPAPFDSWE